MADRLGKSSTVVDSILMALVATFEALWLKRAWQSCGTTRSGSNIALRNMRCFARSKDCAKVSCATSPALGGSRKVRALLRLFFGGFCAHAKINFDFDQSHQNPPKGCTCAGVFLVVLHACE